METGKEIKNIYRRFLSGSVLQGEIQSAGRLSDKGPVRGESEQVLFQNSQRKVTWY